MDCALTQDNLIAYHFATLEDPVRESVEAHLVECTACLRTYLALKSHVDRGRAQEGPSDAARLKLRAAVQQRFRPTPARRVGRWLTRPVPLYQGLALAAAVVLVAALGPQIAERLDESRTQATSERVDTSRTTTESLSIY
jgi:anti-sigma factor RsiW